MVFDISIFTLWFKELWEIIVVPEDKKKKLGT